MDDLRVVLFSGGHPFDEPALLAALGNLPGIALEHVPHPAALERLSVEARRPGEVFLFYDMPGLLFTRGDPPLERVHPPSQFREDLLRTLDDGVGMVFLHHAIASWPSWPEFAELVGGRFHYEPGTMNGIEYPDSGYRFNVVHRVDVLDPTHPVCDGLGAGFEITDELYLFPVLEDRVTPLLATRHPMDDDRLFFSASLAVRGQRNANDGWQHPPGSQLVGWAKRAGNAALVYLQFGDSPNTYADQSYQRVVANALRWVASPQAAAWAMSQPI